MLQNEVGDIDDFTTDGQHEWTLQSDLLQGELNNRFIAISTQY
jgi:hypothetical protein